VHPFRQFVDCIYLFWAVSLRVELNSYQELCPTLILISLQQGVCFNAQIQINVGKKTLHIFNHIRLPSTVFRWLSNQLMYNRPLPTDESGTMKHV
jgi:hypothetical protein